MLLTDPPYNVAYKSKAGTIENDNMTDEKFREFMFDAFRCASSALESGGPFYIWHASRYHGETADALEACDMTVREQLIWNKNTFTLGRQDYQWKHEPCLYGWKNGAAHKWYGDRSSPTVFEDEEKRDINKMKKSELVDYAKSLIDAMHTEKTTVIDCDKPSRSDEHPTMKPVKLMAELIMNSSAKGDTVLDVFGGSGSTLIAAEQTKRKCRMMELDPHYCDVIVARWERLTQMEASKHGS